MDAKKCASLKPEWSKAGFPNERGSTVGFGAEDPVPDPLIDLVLWCKNLLRSLTCRRYTRIARTHSTQIMGGFQTFRTHKGMQTRPKKVNNPRHSMYGIFTVPTLGWFEGSMGRHMAAYMTVPWSVWEWCFDFGQMLGLRPILDRLTGLHFFRRRIGRRQGLRFGHFWRQPDVLPGSFTWYPTVPQYGKYRPYFLDFCVNRPPNR